VGALVDTMTSWQATVMATFGLQLYMFLFRHIFLTPIVHILHYYTSYTPNFLKEANLMLKPKSHHWITKPWKLLPLLPTTLFLWSRCYAWNELVTPLPNKGWSFWRRYLTIIVSVSQYINLLGPVPPNLYTGHLYSPFCQTKLEKDTSTMVSFNKPY